MTLLMMSLLRSSWDMSGLCWVETTTLLTRCGLPSRYWTLTWDFESGRSNLASGTFPDFLMSARSDTRSWASLMGSGMSSSVSSHA